ncbi:MAG TPA: DUF4912 domain-containing protein, partial [Candidatus Eisenbacteria bacterium]|nr:DUF4912 domain-containing protein [Candidatus Eisenbacteria bacterium]
MKRKITSKKSAVRPAAAVRPASRPAARSASRPRKAALLPKPEPAPVAMAPVSLPQPAFELPAQYGDNKVVLLVRDPWWIYAYWEVTQDRERETIEVMRRQGCDKDKTVLRVYDVTGSSVEKPRSFFDIEIAFLASNWYVDVGIPDRDWV